MIKNFMFVISLIFISTASNAAESMNILCRAKSSVTCANRVQSALQKAGCETLESDVACEVMEQKKGLEVCRVQSRKCQEPISLAFTSECRNPLKKLSLKSLDRGLSLTWWFGFSPFYVSTICVE